MTPRQHALVAPFVGDRYTDRARLGEFVTPPYDVITPKDRAMFAARHPYNIVHLILPEPNGDPYARAAALFSEWRDGGVFAADPSPSVYVLRQVFAAPSGEQLTRTGVIGGVAVEPLATGRVKPHERTHAGPKEGRLALLNATGAMFESLFMLARDPSGELRDLMASVTAGRANATAELLGVNISLWRVPKRRATALAGVAGREPLYMADGHHRYETAVQFHQTNPAADRVPSLIVPVGDPGLLVLPTHRLIYGNAVDSEALVDDLRDRFQIRELPATSNYLDELKGMQSRGTACVVVTPHRGALAFMLKGGASLGELPFAAEPTVAALDVARIDGIVVKRLRTAAGEQSELRYSADHHQVIDDVRQGEAAAGVLLNPTPVEQVLAVADAGAVMPPKSTYFMPKVPSGLVVMRYRRRTPSG